MCQKVRRRKISNSIKALPDCHWSNSRPIVVGAGSYSPSTCDGAEMIFGGNSKSRCQPCPAELHVGSHINVSLLYTMDDPGGGGITSSWCVSLPKQLIVLGFIQPSKWYGGMKVKLFNWHKQTSSYNKARSQIFYSTILFNLTGSIRGVVLQSSHTEVRFRE